MVGKNMAPDTPDAQRRMREAFESVGKGTDTSGVVLELRRKDNGKPIWIQWWSKPDPSGTYTRTMFIDITDRVLLEQEQARLKAQNAYLQEELKSVHNFEEIIGASSGLMKVLDKRQARGADRCVGADHRRERHRQGAHRARHPFGEQPCRQAVHQGQLRGAGDESDRKRAVRPRARRLQRRHPAAHRPLRTGAHRHDLSRRDRRGAARRPGQAAARAAGARVRAGGRQPDHQDRRAGDRRHQSRSAQEHPRGEISRRPVLPAQCVSDPPAAAARAPAPTSRC